MGIKTIKTTRYIDEEQGFQYTFHPIEDTLTIEETKEGYMVKYLVQDEDYDSPDTWGDDSLFLVNYHRDFWVTRDKIITENDVRAWYQNEKIDQQKDYHIFMLSCLIHSGVWLSLSRDFSCDPGGWDTSHVGVILASKKEFKTKDKAYKAAEGLINDWNMVLSEDVYGMVAEYYDKDKKQLDHDSVWGCLGYKYAKEELKTFGR